MAPIIYALGALAAGAIGYKAFIAKKRYVGDLAEAGRPIATADQVEVMVPDLIKSNASISIGPNAGQIPAGTASVLVAVMGASKDVLQGPIIAFGTVPLPIPLGSVVVNRADVKAVIRNGKVARSPSGAFAGERSKRFMG